jgi:hypothetical protein
MGFYVFVVFSPRQVESVVEEGGEIKDDEVFCFGDCGFDFFDVFEDAGNVFQSVVMAPFFAV